MERDYSRDIFYVGDQMRQIRERINVSQEELADRIGVSVITIHRIENGIRQPSLEVLLRFSDIMNVPLPMILPARMQNDNVLTEKYRKLSPANQGIVRETVETLMSGLLAVQN